MGRLVEITTGEGRWRPGVIAFCETTLDGPKGAEVSTGRYRVAWGRFESKTHFLEVVAKKNNLKVRIAEARIRRALRHSPKAWPPICPDGGRAMRFAQIFSGTDNNERFRELRSVGDSRLPLTPTLRTPRTRAVVVRVLAISRRADARRGHAAVHGRARYPRRNRRRGARPEIAETGATKRRDAREDAPKSAPPRRRRRRGRLVASPRAHHPRRGARARDERARRRRREALVPRDVERARGGGRVRRLGRNRRDDQDEDEDARRLGGGGRLGRRRRFLRLGKKTATFAALF